jgi:hypothetical protein
MSPLEGPAPAERIMVRFDEPIDRTGPLHFSEYRNRDSNSSWPAGEAGRKVTVNRPFL